MNNVKKVYEEVCQLKPINMADLVKARLEAVLRVYVEELSESQNSLIRGVSKESLYKELSKTKWMRR